MDPAIAALIGAGTAAAASLAGQIIFHRLSLNRDRKATERARQTEAIVDAGLALFGPLSDERMSDEELGAWSESLDPKSVAAGDPEAHRDMLPFWTSIYRGSVTLQLHFGVDHELVKAYDEAAAICSEAEAEKHAHLRSDDEDWRISNIPHLADVALEARQAREHWMKLAHSVVGKV